MSYRIRCKKSHPGGQLRRGGELYTTEGVVVDEVPAAVAEELAQLGRRSALEVEPIAADPTPAPQPEGVSQAEEGDEDLLDFPVSTVSEDYEVLRQRAAERGITFRKKPTKKELVEALNSDQGEPAAPAAPAEAE